MRSLYHYPLSYEFMWRVDDDVVFVREEGEASRFFHVSVAEWEKLDKPSHLLIGVSGYSVRA